MEYKYQVTLEEDKRTITFGKWKMDCYLDIIELPKSTKARYIHICHDVFAQNKLSPLIKYYADKKALYTSFTKEFGISPSRFVSYIKKLQYMVWCDGIDAKILWACCGGGAYKRVLYPSKLKHLPEVKPDLIQLKKDGIENLSPLVHKYKMSPQELKEKFGKGIWKKFCKNSLTRNSLICSRIPAHTPAETDTKTVITGVLDYPSSALKYNEYCYSYGFHGYGQLLKKEKLCTNKYEGAKLINTVSDTIRMLVDLGKEYNPNWSYKRWQEEHDKAAKEILAREHSPIPFDEDPNWIIVGKYYQVLPREFTCEHGSAKLLMSRLAVAQEGTKMRHCVGGYAERCAKGKYAVYHITDNEGEEATLGLTLDKEGFWQIQQCYSYSNSKATDHCMFVRTSLYYTIHDNQTKENK